MATKERESGMEFLRVIAILMVITVHYLGGILAQNWNEMPKINMIFAHILESLAIIGVNLFVLISGYFGVKSKGLNIRRLLNIILTVVFWGGVLYIVSIIVWKDSHFDLRTFGYSLFPYIIGHAWYVRAYLILMVLSPFLNVLMCSITRKAYLILLGIMTVVFSILPSFNPAFANNNGYDIIHFVFLYLCGGFFALHSLPALRKEVYLLGYLLFCVMTSIFSVYGDGLNYWGYDFISVVLSSLCLFLFFMRMHFISSFINTLGKLTFGIYILNTSIPNLYTYIIPRESMFESYYMIFHYLGFTAVFFIVASAAEWIRQLLFSGTVDKLLNRIPFMNRRILQSISKCTEE